MGFCQSMVRPLRDMLGPGWTSCTKSLHLSPRRDAHDTWRLLRPTLREHCLCPVHLPDGPSAQRSNFQTRDCPTCRHGRQRSAGRQPPTEGTGATYRLPNTNASFSPGVGWGTTMGGATTACAARATTTCCPGEKHVTSLARPLGNKGKRPRTWGTYTNHRHIAMPRRM